MPCFLAALSPPPNLAVLSLVHQFVNKTALQQISPWSIPLQEVVFSQRLYICPCYISLDFSLSNSPVSPGITEWQHSLQMCQLPLTANLLTVHSAYALLIVRGPELNTVLEGGLTGTECKGMITFLFLLPTVFLLQWYNNNNNNNNVICLLGH